VGVQLLTYLHALLLNWPILRNDGAANRVDRPLALDVARKVFPYAQQRETEGPVIVIDLDAPAGASLVAVAPRHTSEATRFGYPAKLATSVRGRLKRLASGANPAELQLGHEVSVEASAALLSHLDSRWYALPKRRATKRRPARFGVAVSAPPISASRDARSTARTLWAGCPTTARSIWPHSEP
jgi:hypothetical protein